MNDTEVLTWVAEHLVRLDIGIHFVELEWIDNGGFTQHKKFETIPMETDVEILRNAVTAIAAP